MFALAADIENYPRFVPLCESAVIHERKSLGDGREAVTASLVVAYDKLRLRETFLSDVVLDRKGFSIQAISNSGPVKYLETDWLFHDLPNGRGCRISFAVHYRMRSGALQVLMGMMFDRAFEKIARAFRERAVYIYAEHDGTTTPA